ncbi:hypothetical protein ACHHYP_15162 [Achlya hypogyna]|uniref:Beta-adaptin appendage C-terminal subdomain domain-containing protein n=1 Tax=Achlya hypogyna TaxID=1202772 RepID=A0A1V9YBI2_ACHHY|nr:hypothetical protein ACHHYP_15162 [Achlya hypogyna]
MDGVVPPEDVAPTAEMPPLVHQFALASMPGDEPPTTPAVDPHVATSSRSPASPRERVEVAAGTARVKVSPRTNANDESMHAETSPQVNHEVAPENPSTAEPPVDASPSVSSSKGVGARRAVTKKYAVAEPGDSDGDVKDEAFDAFSPDDLPPSERPKLKLKLKRQLTFQQRQRRVIRRHKRVLMTTSHSLWAFLSYWVRTLLSLHTHEWMAYLLIVFGLIGECTTPGPRYNVAIGTLLLTVPVKKIELHLTTTGMVFAIVVDLFWLCRPDELSYSATFPWQLTSFCRVWGSLCMLLKVWLSLSVYWYLEPQLKTAPSERPPKPQHLKWQVVLDRARFFFPTTVLPPPAQMSRAVLLRIVALLYIYCVGGAVLFALGIVSCFSFTMYPQFQQTPLGIPLHYMILASGAATTATLLLFLSNLHTPIWRCLSLLWRLSSYTGPLVHWHGVGYTNDLNWIKMVTTAKLVDSCCGLYLLLVLYGAFHHGSSFYSGVTAVLVLATAITVLLQAWVPLLLLVLYKFIGTMEQTHRDFDSYHLLPRNWAAEDHATDAEADGTNASSASEASSSDESSSSDSSSSTGDHDAQSHHRRRRRNTTKRQEPGVVAPDVWLRYHDAYHRAYVRNSVTGETFWDDAGGSFDDASPLSSTMYLTHDDFKYLWNSLEYAGGFACRIHVLPTVEALTEHLAACRFYVITDGMASETVRAVYFYAVHTASLAHFLGAFLLDSLSQELEAKFKCDQPEMLPAIVQCLQLKALLGEYDELR